MSGVEKKIWTVSEDVRLKEGVKKYGGFAWKRVSGSIFNNRRTWRECKERFEILTEPKVWTMEEDARLEKEVAKFGSHIQWATVASVMKRPQQSCLNRYFSQRRIPTTTPVKALGSNSIKILKPPRTPRFSSGMKPKIQL